LRRYEIIEFDDGIVIEHYFQVFGPYITREYERLHRNDGPADIERRPNGTLIEKWYREGRLHREGGPAITARYGDGTVTEEWYRDDKMHREDGPAAIMRRPDGTVTEEWFHNGSPIRTTTPRARRARRTASPKSTNG
jgi:hypothetical protein